MIFRFNPDVNLRSLIRQWHSDPNDLEVRRALDHMAKRAGGISIYDAMAYRVIAQEILTHPDHVFEERMPGVLDYLGIKSPHGFAERFAWIDPGYRFEDYNVPGPLVLTELIYTLLPDPAYPEHARPQQEILGETIGGFLNDYKAYSTARRVGGCKGAHLPEHLKKRRRRYCGQSILRLRSCFCRNMCIMCEHRPQDCVCELGGPSHVLGGRAAVWVHPFIDLCDCHGGGWVSTDYDTVHQCPIHPIRSHHPECGAPDGVPVEGCCVPATSVDSLSDAMIADILNETPEEFTEDDLEDDIEDDLEDDIEDDLENDLYDEVPF